jgi:hypothetical protein
MEAGELLGALRVRLNEIERQLIGLHALKQEHASLLALIRHYERVQSGLVALPEQAETEEDKAEALASFPRLMAFTVRRLLLADVGPTATVPDLYLALPPKLQSQFSGRDVRSNIETLRSQIIKWKDDAGLVYQTGGLVSVAPSESSERPHSYQRPRAMVLRSGTYECSTHEFWKEEYEQEQNFGTCPVGGDDCRWEYSADNRVTSPKPPQVIAE